MNETLIIRIPKPLKKDLKHLATEQEKTMSEIVVTLLTEYVNDHKK